MAAKFFVAALALVAMLVHAGHCLTIDQLDASTIEQMEKLDAKYKATIDSLFHGQLKEADRLRAEGSLEAACALRTIAQVAMVGETTSYLAQRQALVAALFVLRERFGTDADHQRAIFAVAEEPIERYELLMTRATLRGSADGIRLSDSARNWLYKLVEEYRSEPAVQGAIKLALGGVSGQRAELEAVYCEQANLLLRLKGAGGQNLLDEVDRELDNQFGCPLCQEGAVREADLKDTYPLISEPVLLKWLTEEFLKLNLDAFSPCDEARQFTAEELGRVTRSDVSSLVKEIL